MAKPPIVRQEEPAQPVAIEGAIIPLTAITPGQTALVGGKGSSLGALIRAGLPVPPGFVISTNYYRAFHHVGIPESAREAILVATRELGNSRVAVRSSAIAEDSKNTSWAGQFDTVLNVTEANVITAIEKCWASAQSQRVMDYAAQNNIPDDELSLAVVVQAMVDSEISGVVFTQNPISGYPEEIMIEACFGLGELLVQGMVTPDNYLVHKRGLKVVARTHHEQKGMLAWAQGKTMALPVPNPSAPKLSDEQITDVARLAQKIEDHYGHPQDIEWALAMGKVYIVQSRPITTLDTAAE